MGGWDVRRVQLGEPYNEFWIEVYLDPPMGLYLEMQTVLRDAIASHDEAVLDRALALMKECVADSNLVTREGAPLDKWTTRTVGGKLVGRLGVAIRSVIENDEGGASADPLPTTRRAASPGRGSPAPRSRRSTRSGGSRAA